MTARPQVELPELQRYDLEECDWVVGIVKKDDGAYVKFDDYAALAARLAESEARAEVDARRLDWLVGQTRLIDLYNMVAQYCDCPMPTTPALARAAIDAAIDAAQEAERDSASA